VADENDRGPTFAQAPDQLLDALRLDHAEEAVGSSVVVATRPATIAASPAVPAIAQILILDLPGEVSATLTHCLRPLNGLLQGA
jgi:hypothetical protein